MFCWPQCHWYGKDAKKCISEHITWEGSNGSLSVLPRLLAQNYTAYSKEEMSMRRCRSHDLRKKM